MSLGSVRVRTLLTASLLTATVLVLGSWVLVRLVERELLDAARITVDHVLEGEHSETTDTELRGSRAEEHAREGRERSEHGREEHGREGREDHEHGHARTRHEHQLVPAQSLREIRDRVDALARALLLIVPILVLALGTATWFLVGSALRPVRAISQRVANITSSTLDERVPEPDGRDEIAELARLMNQMLDRLQEGSERQRQFVADASHELRSPLSTLKAAAEVAQVSPDPHKLQRLAGDMIAETDRMEALLADLLDLARLDEERPVAETERLDLLNLCQQTLTRLPNSTTQIVLRASEPVVIEAVPGQLERAVVNLLDNAIQHGTSRVEVEVRRSSERALLVVDDDGAGIPTADRQRIFDRFVRLDSARGRDSGGVGIGLALVQSIAERHGGRVVVDQAPTLGGARFTLAIPVAPASVDIGDCYSGVTSAEDDGENRPNH